MCVIHTLHTGKFPIHNHFFCFWSPCNSTLRWQIGLGVPPKSATHLLLVWSINKIVSPFWSTLSLIDPFLTILGPKTPFLVFFWEIYPWSYTTSFLARIGPEKGEGRPCRPNPQSSVDNLSLKKKTPMWSPHGELLLN